jgi:hypothetical protein
MEIEEVTLKNGKKIYVKERRFGVGIVNPIQKDITKPFGKGNINWQHLFFGGSFMHFLSVTFSYYLIIYFLLFAYWHDTHAMKIVYEHPKCFVESNLQSMGLTSQQCVEVEKAGNYTSNLKLGNITVPKFK